MAERGSKRAKTNSLSSSSELALKISHELKLVQFINQPFDVTVFLQEAGRMKTGGPDLDLTVSLSFEDPGMRHEDLSKLLRVEGSPRVVNGRASFGVTLTDSSMNVGNRKMCLIMSAAGIAQPTRSAGILVIKHQIKVRLAPGSWERSWYKDEGGRDKSISIPVQLVDHSGALVTDREVHLSYRLLYENGTEVPSQQILRVHESSATSIVNGVAEIKVRIEEVSRNHQHQDFQIEIGPEVVAHPLDQDVGLDLSPSVTVLSKLNKRTRQTPRSVAAAQSTVSTPAAAAAAAAATVSLVEGAQATAAGLSAALSSANSAVAASAAGAGLPNPDGGQGLQGAMENLLSWVSTVLVTLQAQNSALTALQQQNSQIERVLSSYSSVVMVDLQKIVSDLERVPRSVDGHMLLPRALSADPSLPPLPLDTAGPLPPPPPTNPSLNRNDSLGPMPELDALAMTRPAAMNRQQSVSYIPGDSGVGSGASALSRPYASIPSLSSPGESDDAEKDVFFLVAKVFVTSTSRIGFPAFSRDKELLGFYREVEGGGQTAAERLEFLPLAHAKSHGGLCCLSEEVVAKGAKSLEKEITRQSKSVFKLEDFGSSVENFKMAALVYYLEKSPTGSTDGFMARQPSLDVDTLSRELVRGTSSNIDPNWFFEL